MSDSEELQPHQKRVKDERDELESKIQNLAAFFGGDVFHTLDPVDKYLLVEQAEHMTAYRGVLDLRIARF